MGVDAPVAPGTKPATIRPGTEVFIVASFLDPWTSEADEVKAMRASCWEPSDTAFAAVTNVHSRSFAKVSTLGEFMGAIINTLSGTPRPKGSVSRINLLTHGNPGLIGFSGTVSVTRDSSGDPSGVNVFFQAATLPVTLSYPQLDTDAINWLNTGGVSVRDDFRDVLRPDAQFFIYACHGGAGQGVLLCVDLANTLDLGVRAFHDAVHYDPTFTFGLKGKPDRVISRDVMFYQSGSHERGYKHLTPDVLVPKPGQRTP